MVDCAAWGTVPTCALWLPPWADWHIVALRLSTTIHTCDMIPLEGTGVDFLILWHPFGTGQIYERNNVYWHKYPAIPHCGSLHTPQPFCLFLKVISLYNYWSPQQTFCIPNMQATNHAAARNDQHCQKKRKFWINAFFFSIRSWAELPHFNLNWAVTALCFKF